MKNIAKEINKSKVIAVLQIDLLENVMPLCEALLKQGINIIELALRTNVSQKATELILKNFPDILVGLGTVVHEDQVRFAVDTGVNFAVSPGCNTKIIDLALKNKLPFFPGISSPTDIEISIDHGCQILKFFPAENFGGINYFKNLLYALSKHNPKEVKIFIFFSTDMPEETLELFRPYARVVRTNILYRYSFLWFLNQIFVRILKSHFIVNQMLKRYSINILSHSWSVIKPKSFYKIISWIPDFQYLHLPEHFEKHHKKNGW